MDTGSREVRQILKCASLLFMNLVEGGSHPCTVPKVRHCPLLYSFNVIFMFQFNANMFQWRRYFRSQSYRLLTWHKWIQSQRGERARTCRIYKTTEGSMLMNISLKSTLPNWTWDQKRTITSSEIKALIHKACMREDYDTLFKQ